MVKLVGVETYINGDLAKATLIASRLSSRAATIGDTDLSKALSQLAERYYSAIEANIALVSGARKIQEQSGRGLQVDLIKIDASSSKYQVSEIKSSLLRTIIKETKKGTDFRIQRDSAISLGSVLSIGLTGTSKLTTGYKVLDGEQIQEEVTELKGTDFFVATYKNNINKLREDLVNPANQSDPLLRDILTAVSKNLETKALTLSLPFYINKKKTGITTLQFTRDYILKNATLFYSSGEAGDSIKISFSYKQSIINDGLKKAANSAEVRSSISEYDSKFENYVDNLLKNLPNNAQKIAYFANLITNIEKRLKNKSFSADIIYVKGSVMAYIGQVQVSNKRKLLRERTQQPEQSIVRLTELVQGRVRLKMRRGVGVARPSKIYERTGTFRSSIDVYADFRSRQIDYFYLPYYDSLEEYGYEINNLVTESIRAIMQERYSTQFALRRKTI
jgi:hypothetical protein